MFKLIALNIYIYVYIVSPGSHFQLVLKLLSVDLVPQSLSFVPVYNSKILSLSQFPLVSEALETLKLIIMET